MKTDSKKKSHRHKLAIWAGAGVLPYYAAMNAHKRTEVLIVAFKEVADIEFLKKTGCPLQIISIGEIGKNLRLLKRERIDHLVMLGKFEKVFLWGKTKFDLGALSLLLKAGNLRDMSIFQVLADKLESLSIEVVPQLMYLPDQTVDEGILTKHRPSKEQLEDARYGLKTAKMMADLDIGQTVIVKKGTVLAVETIQGTDATILAVPDHFAKGSLMAKATRTKQDPRFDIATVGLTTIHNLAKKGIKALALEKSKTILVDKQTVIREADRCGICIMAL